MSGPEKSTSDLVAESLNGITGITVSKDSGFQIKSFSPKTAVLTVDAPVSESKVRHFVKVRHRLIEVSSGNEEEQILEIQRMGILTVPKKPTPKSSRPKDVLAPGFKKRRHKILERIKARKKGK